MNNDERSEWIEMEMDEDSWLEDEIELILTRQEVLLLSDQTSVMVSQDVAEQKKLGVVRFPIRRIAASATIPVSFNTEIKIMECLSKLDNNNEVNAKFSFSEILAFKECCNSKLVYKGEKVGLNLLMKLSKLISDAYKRNNVPNELDAQLDEILKSRGTNNDNMKGGRI